MLGRKQKNGETKWMLHAEHFVGCRLLQFLILLSSNSGKCWWIFGGFFKGKPPRCRFQPTEKWIWETSSYKWRDGMVLIAGKKCLFVFSKYGSQVLSMPCVWVFCISWDPECVPHVALPCKLVVFMLNIFVLFITLLNWVGSLVEAISFLSALLSEMLKQS